MTETEKSACGVKQAAAGSKDLANDGVSELRFAGFAGHDQKLPCQKSAI